MEDLFSPLSKKYCIWFYYLSVISYIFFIVGVLGAIIYGVKHNKSFGYYLSAGVASISYFVMYFQNRLLFSMCTHP